MFALVSSLSLIAVGQATPVSAPPLGTVVADAITYRIQPGVVWVPLRLTMEAAGVMVEYDTTTASITLMGTPIPMEETMEIREETFIKLSALQALASPVGFRLNDEGDRHWSIEYGAYTSWVRAAPHRVEISIREQRLRGWQGDRLVIQTNVSTGRGGFATPRGEFRSGPEYSRHRVSRRYDNAPMPYSVQVEGGVFIHGSRSVPRYPASHGCIRMPLTGNNPARLFFEWVEPDSPIIIATDFVTPPPMADEHPTERI
jgi:hypothetical protein